MYTSRWIVSYKGDPYLLVDTVGAHSKERIQTFKTKRAATLAAQEHAASLKAQSQP
jgi:hypothetical protein